MTTLVFLFKDHSWAQTSEQNQTFAFLPSLALKVLNLRLISLHCPEATRRLCLRHAAWRLKGGSQLLPTIRGGVVRGQRLMME